MGEVFNFSTGQEMPPREVKRKADLAAEQSVFEENCGRLAEERLPDLVQRFKSMTLTEALETRAENPEAIVDDIDQVKMEGIRTVQDRQVERLIHDTFAEHLARTGSELSDEQRRALGNYIQLRDKDGMVGRRASLMLAEPAAEWDERVQQLRNQIEEKQVGLLRECLGPEIADQADELESFVAEGWQSGEWQSELTERTEAITASPTNDPKRYLDAIEMIGSIQFDDASQQPVDLTRVRNLKEAQKAFEPEQGDPSSVKNTSNRFLNSAAELARLAQIEVSSRRAAETLRFLHEKLQARLTEMSRKNIRAV